MKFSSTKKGQGGFALIDVLMATVAVSFIVLAMVKLQAQTNDETTSKVTAESMEKVTEIFSQYLVTNRGDGSIPKIIQAMTDGSNASSWCVINANTSTGVGTNAVNTTLHTCAVDISFLKYKKFVPMSYPELNSFGQRWTAVYRLVYEDFDNNGATANTSDGSVEMLIVGATNGGTERSANARPTVLAATLAGFNGGYIPNGSWGNCNYNGTEKSACGSGGSWKADLSKFLNTP